MSAALPTGDPTGEAPDEQAVSVIESRLAQLDQLVRSQGDSTGQIGQLMQGLQAQLSQLNQTAQQAARERQGTKKVEPSEEFQKFYADMPKYIREQALVAAREAMGPHLAHQAIQTRDGILAMVASQVDEEHGDGFFDEHIRDGLTEAIQRIPLEYQSSRDHIEAALGAAMGRLYLNPETRQVLETRRSAAAKAREEAMNMLPNGRPMPPKGDKLEDRHRTFLDSLARSGINFTEDEYKAAMKTTGDDIDSWEASKAASAKGGKK